jgi:hypothetical protein
MFIIYGATNPGVPHLTNKYFYSSEYVARPKSHIIVYKVFEDLNIIFYGLISR